MACSPSSRSGRPIPRLKGAVAEQQAFKLVHHDERDETPGIEARSHLFGEIGQDRVFHTVRLSRHWQRRGLSAPRSSLTLFLRQAVIIDQSSRDTSPILQEMLHNVRFNGVPSPNTAAPLTQAGITDNSSFDGMAASCQRGNHGAPRLRSFPRSDPRRGLAVAASLSSEPVVRRVRSSPRAGRGCTLPAMWRMPHRPKPKSAGEPRR